MTGKMGLQDVHSSGWGAGLRKLVGKAVPHGVDWPHWTLPGPSPVPSVLPLTVLSVGGTVGCTVTQATGVKFVTTSTSEMGIREVIDLK